MKAIDFDDVMNIYTRFWIQLQEVQTFPDATHETWIKNHWFQGCHPRPGKGLVKLGLKPVPEEQVMKMKGEEDLFKQEEELNVRAE